MCLRCWTDREVVGVFTFLFAVYLDGLLVELSKFGAGCHWGSSLAVAFSYADDVVLLAPCALALRTMLNICGSFAVPQLLNLIQCRLN